nr:membrane metallo-endopeptidase-like 1 [Parasteatoda tepidariorum]
MISRFFWKCGVYWMVSVSVAILYLAFIHKKNINLLKENDVSKSEKLMSCKDVCLTKECIQAASSLLESIDENKSPCEDFYSFACGKWMAKFTENENHTMIEAMKENLKAAVKEVINEIEDSSESSAGKLKTLYETCVNYSSSEQNAIPSALLFLERLGIEGWPNLALDFKFTNSTLEEVLAMLISHNEFAFMYFHNSQDLMKFSVSFRL